MALPTYLLNTAKDDWELAAIIFALADTTPEERVEILEALSSDTEVIYSLYVNGLVDSYVASYLVDNPTVAKGVGQYVWCIACGKSTSDCDKYVNSFLRDIVAGRLPTGIDEYSDWSWQEAMYIAMHPELSPHMENELSKVQYVDAIFVAACKNRSAEVVKRVIDACHDKPETALASRIIVQLHPALSDEDRLELMLKLG